jgi:hypothetical protein
VLEIAEKLDRFQQGFRVVASVLHGQHSTLKCVVCQVLYFAYSQSFGIPVTIVHTIPQKRRGSHNWH